MILLRWASPLSIYMKWTRKYLSSMAIVSSVLVSNFLKVRKFE